MSVMKINFNMPAVEDIKALYYYILSYPCPLSLYYFLYHNMTIGPEKSTGVTVLAAIFIEMLKKEFNLNEQETSLLGKTTRQMKREDRRLYFGHLKRREKAFKEYLLRNYMSLEPQQRKEWLEAVVQSMLERGGEPDLADNLVMGIVGRLPVYHRLRERSEKEGFKLKALVNFGGMGAVIMLVGAITALVLYLTAR